jgi:hypothetical protein
MAFFATLMSRRCAARGPPNRVSGAAVLLRHRRAGGANQFVGERAREESRLRRGGYFAVELPLAALMSMLPEEALAVMVGPPPLTAPRTVRRSIPPCMVIG